MNKPDYSPSLWGALKLLFVATLFDALACLTMLPFSLWFSTSLLNPILGIPITLLGFSLTLLWLKRSYHLNLITLLDYTRFDFSLLLPMFITVLGVSIVTSELNNYMLLWLPMPDFWIDLFKSFDPKTYGFTGVFITVAALAPVVEEIEFRGLILKGFSDRHSPKMAILASAFLFALVHGNPWQFPIALIMGILLGWWFIKTRSLIPCIALHAFHNALPYVLMLTPLQISGYTTSGSTFEAFQPWWFTLAGAFALFAGVLWCKRCFSSSCRIDKNISNSDRSS